MFVGLLLQAYRAGCQRPLPFRVNAYPLQTQLCNPLLFTLQTAPPLPSSPTFPRQATDTQHLYLLSYRNSTYTPQSTVVQHLHFLLYRHQTIVSPNLRIPNTYTLDTTQMFNCYTPCFRETQNLHRLRTPSTYTLDTRQMPNAYIHIGSCYHSLFHRHQLLHPLTYEHPALTPPIIHRHSTLTLSASHTPKICVPYGHPKCTPSILHRHPALTSIQVQAYTLCFTDTNINIP